MNEPADILRTHYAQRCQGELFLETAKGGGVNSQNFLVRLNKSAPKFVLKAEPLTGKTSAWKSRLAFQQQVAQCEPLVPSIIVTDDAQLGLEENGRLWRLLEFRAGALFSGGKRELVSAAQGLANLHRHLRDLPGIKPVSPLYDHLSTAEIADILRSLDGPIGNTPFGRHARQLVTTVLPPLTTRIHQVESDTALPQCWVHRDFHPGNALFSGDKLTAILDLDSLATDFRMQAVAFAASRFAGRDTENLWAFLIAYHTVDPLTPMELKLVPDFIRREAMRRLNWIIRVNVLQGQDLWRGDLEKQADILEHVKNLEVAFAWSDTALLQTLVEPVKAGRSGKP